MSVARPSALLPVNPISTLSLVGGSLESAQHFLPSPVVVFSHTESQHSTANMGCSKDLVEGDNAVLSSFTRATQLLQSSNVGSGIGPAIGAKADSIHTTSLLRHLDGLLEPQLT